MSADLARALEIRREAEKSQALFYRALAALAEDAGDEALSERFQGLHADEQHHLSRLTARLVELGHHPADLSALRPPAATLAGWQGPARAREEEEVRGYAALLSLDLDESTRRLVEAIASVERSHAEELGGKWTMA